jgi:hypothetical protein
MKILIFTLLIAFKLHANPFLIDFPLKEELTHEDYIEVQQKLRAIDIRPLLEELYVPNQGLQDISDFASRTSRGIRRVLIDPEKGLYPKKKLEKMGCGGECCIVSCAPFDGVRNICLEGIQEALRLTGFNGYFYYRLGGFPNPTGKEIRYAGVPYCLKIFMLIEAQKLGFNKLLWIDSACLPIRDPTPLFQWMDQTGIYFHQNRENLLAYILPSTRQLLKDLTGTDVVHAIRIRAALFGLKMDSPLAKELIEDYYRMVELGTPFLSCFPEEFVLAALLGKLRYPTLLPSPFPFLPDPVELGKETQEKRSKWLQDGYFFSFIKH